MDSVERRVTNTGHSSAGKSIEEDFDLMNSKKNLLFIAALPLMFLTLLSLVAAANPGPTPSFTFQSAQENDKREIRRDRRDIKRTRRIWAEIVAMSRAIRRISKRIV